MPCQRAPTECEICGPMQLDHATWFTERSFTDDERDNALGDLVDEGARVVVTSTVAEPYAE